MIQPVENDLDRSSIQDSNQLELSQALVPLPPATLYQTMIDNGLARIRGEIDAIQTLNTALLIEYNRLFMEKEQLESELNMYKTNVNQPVPLTTIKKKPNKQKPRQNPTNLHFRAATSIGDQLKQTAKRARACFNLEPEVKQEPLTQLLPTNILSSQQESQQSSLKQTSMLDYLQRYNCS